MNGAAAYGSYRDVLARRERRGPDGSPIWPLPASMTKACAMCFGTGRTRRYRGTDSHGPCMACRGAGTAPADLVSSRAVEASGGDRGITRG